MGHGVGCMGDTRGCPVVRLDCRVGTSSLLAMSKVGVREGRGIPVARMKEWLWGRLLNAGEAIDSPGGSR